MSDQSCRPFEPRDITRMRWVSDPRISPDGRRVAFVVTTLSEDEDAYRSAVWMVNTDGASEPRQFTAGPKRDTAPRWSPDGSRLAFLSERGEGDAAKPQIYLIRADGGEPRPLTDRKEGAGAPVWSPDGGRIAFAARVNEHPEPTDDKEKKKSRPARTITTLKYKSNGEGFVYDRRPHIFVVPVDPGAEGPAEAVQVTDGDYSDSSPAWSPDSRSIAFASARHEGRDFDNASDIWLVDVAGGAAGHTPDAPRGSGATAAPGADADWRLPDAPHSAPILGEVWPESGAEVAAAEAAHDAAGGEPPDPGTAAPTPGPASLLGEAWPEASGEGARPEQTAGAPGASGAPRRLTDTSGPAGSPVFSPDGMRVAYLGHRYPTDAARNTRVWTIPASGGAATCVTKELDRTSHFDGVEWSPDGSTLLFAIEEKGTVPVYRAAADGSGTPSPVLTGERQVTSFTTSKDGGRIAFTATDPVTPAEVYVCAADGSGERQLTNLNRGWCKEVALSRPEHSIFERDGFTLDLWVMKPAGWQEGTTYPALLNVHGGPAKQYGYNLFDEFQTYAGAGYTVIFTNPRGSQGYGEVFTRAVVGDWGGGDYADVIAALDEALRRYPWIDPERLGMLGGSYGGFMTSWAVSHTDRFKAACSERALNTFISMYGTSDIGHSFPDAYSGAPPPYEDLSWYIEHSPQTYTTNITTPLLIMHAENDLRCPIEQAEQLYVALKKQRKDVVFVRFPDEDHEMSRSGRPRHRLERFNVLLEWFGKYLMGDGG